MLEWLPQFRRTGYWISVLLAPVPFWILKRELLKMPDNKPPSIFFGPMNQSKTSAHWLSKEFRFLGELSL